MQIAICEIGFSESPLHKQASEDTGGIAGHSVDGISVLVSGFQLAVGHKSEIATQLPALQEFPLQAHSDRDFTVTQGSSVDDAVIAIIEAPTSARILSIDVGRDGLVPSGSQL